MKNYGSKYALIKNNIKESLKIFFKSILISSLFFFNINNSFSATITANRTDSLTTFTATNAVSNAANITCILFGICIPASNRNNAINSGVTYTINSITSNFTYSNNFSGAGTLRLDGSARVAFSGGNSLTGTLRLNGPDAIISGTFGSLGAVRITNSNSNLLLNRHDIFGNHSSSSPSVTFTAGGTLSNGANRFNHIGAVTLVNGSTITTDGNHSSNGTAIAGLNLDGDITLGNNATANFNSTNSGNYGLGTGENTVNRNFTIGSNSTLNVNGALVNGQAATWPNHNTASITKLGNGTLVLAGANTYTGNTTVSAGTLEITGTLGASASYAGTISNSGTLTFNSSSNQTLTGSVTGSGTWNKSGSGRLTTSASNSHNGTININDGTFRITSTGGSSSMTVNVLSGGTLDLDDKNFNAGSRTITLEGTGDGNVGALYLSEGGSDNTAFNNSTIQLNADASIGAASGDTLRLYDGDSDTVITSQGSENNSLTITGSGKVEVEDKINIGTGNITVGSNATLEIEGSQNTITAGTVTVNGTLIADTNDIFGVNNATSRPSMVLNGTFTNESGHVSILGNTTLNGGTINISDGHSYSGSEIALGLDGTVTVGGSSASTINSTSGNGTISLTHNNAAGSRDVTFNVADATSDSSVDLTINANIQDGVGNSYPTTVASGIIKTGAGELQLQGANTYTGSTVINAGTLRIKGTSSDTASLANTDVTINNGGIFILGNYSSINSGADIDINSGGEMRVKQNLSNAITISGNGTGDLSNSGALINTGGSNTYSSTITVDGGATVSASSGTMTFSPGSGNAFTGTGNLTFLAANTITVNSSIAGVADIIKSGNEKLNLYGTNTYTGNTIVSGGTFNINGTVPTTTELVFQSPSSTPNVSFKNDSNITIGGIDGDVAGDGVTPEVLFDSVGTRDRDYTLNVATGRTLTTNANVAGPGYGDGQLFKTGAGSQTILGSISGFGSTSAKGLTVQNGTLTLGSSNQIVGGVAITGGTLVVPADASLGVDPGSFDDDNIQIGNGTLQFSNSGTITLNPNRGIDVTHDSATINVSNSSGRVDYSGDIKGDNNLTKTGSGIFALGAANTQDLTGDVTINGGQFRFLSGTSNAYNFDVTVGNTGVASINNNSFASGKSVTVQSGGSLNLYPGSGAGRTFGVDINLAGSGNNNLNGGTAATLTTSSGSNATLTGTITLNSNASVLMRPNGAGVSGKIFFGNADGNTTTAVALGSNTFTLKAEGSNTREYDFRDQVTGTGTLDIDRYTTANFISGEGSFVDTVNLDVQGTLNMSSSDTIASLTGTSTGSIDLRNTTLTINQSSNTTYAGAITDSTGTSSIIKSGTGTLTLNGTNSYSGNTTIRAGNLSISAENNLGSTPGSADADNIIFNGGGLTITSGVTFSGNRGVTMTGAGTINTASSTTSTIQGIITGSGTLTKAGDGDLILSGTNTHSGTLAITDGTLVLSGTLNDTQAVTVSSGATFDTSGDETIGSIAGAGTLDIEHKSQLTVGGDNSSTIFSGIIQSNSGTGTGGITKQGTGTLTLSGNNTFSGGVTVASGTIAVTANNALGDTTNTTTIQSGATIDFQNVNYSTTEILRSSGTIAASTGTSSFAGEVQLVADSDLDVDGTQLTLGGVVSGSSALNKTGNGIAILSGTNTYSGNTSITEGTLRVAGTLNNSTNVTVSSGATYDVDATDQVGSIAGAGTIDIASSVTLSAGNSGNTSVSGVVSGSGNLRKLGSGTLTLSGTNNYSGTTTINNGRLTVSGTLNDNTIVSVASGAIYDVDETDEIGSVFGNGNIEIASSKTLTSGDADGSSTTRTIGGIISGAGGFTKKGEGRLNLTGDSTYTGTTSITNGQLRLQSGSSIDSTAINVSGDGRLYLESEDALVSTANITLNGAASRLYVAEDNTVNTVSGAGGIHIQSDNILTVTDISNHTGKVKGQGDIVIAASHTLGAFIDTTDSSNDNINTRISGASTTVTMAASNFLPDDEDLSIENSGTLNLNSNTDTVANVNLTSGTISGGTINASNQHTISSGTIASTATLGGAGALSKTSSGTTTFAGTGSYSGATTISAGTLTVTGALSNTTGVTLSGGTMNLNSTSAVNSSADMTVSSGSLNVNENITVADFTSSSGTATTIASGRMLTVNPGTANNDIYGLAGSGGFKKMGSVRSILRGSHSYTGETRVTEGILQLASGGSINSSTDLIIESGAEFDLDESITAASLADAGNVDVASSKVLTINGSGTKTFSGRLRGSGGFTYSGSGTMTFRGNNDISGPISFDSGTIYAGIAADSATTIFSNNITLAGATLGGGGKLGGNVTSTGGSLAPGNSIGTLTIDGNLTLDSSSTTTMEFDPSNSDLILVNGDISLDGSLMLEPASGTYSAGVYTLIDGNSGSGNTLSGTFASTTVNNSSNISGFTTSISYDTDLRRVFLTLGETSVDTVKSKTSISGFKDIAQIFDTNTASKFVSVKNHLTDSGTDTTTVNKELEKLKGTVFTTAYAQPVLNHNQFNRALNSVTSSNVTTSLVSSFANHTDELTLASLQESGLYGQKDKFNEHYDYSDTSVLGFIKNNKNKSILDNFVSEDRASFIRTYGTTADRDNIGSSYTGYKSETTGILFGQQYKNDDVTFSGYSYGFTGTDTDYKNNYGESKTYSAHASLFRQIDKEDFGLNFISGMYVSKTESERNVIISGASINDKYLSDYWDVGFNQEAQFIKKFNIAGLNLAPSAKLNSTYVVKSDTKETGGDLALTIDNENLFIVKPEIGLSIARDFSQKEKITNEFSVAVFASQDHFLEGTTSNARFTSGSSFNVDLPRDEETYLSAGLGYNFLNKETDTSLMANAFMMENDRNDMSSNIFSLTFRKLFGEFGKGTIPPVIAKKSENEDIVKIDLPERTEEEIIRDGEKSLEELEKNIEIVLKDNPSEEEVAEVYKSMSESLVSKKELTVNDVYNNLSANCYAVENNLVELVEYYNKLQLYKILDRCNKLSEPKVHLIAERLHQIQLDETTALQELYYGYLRFLNYIPFITFIAFVILAYEFIRRYIVNYFRSRRAV